MAAVDEWTLCPARLATTFPLAVRTDEEARRLSEVVVEKADLERARSADKANRNLTMTEAVRYVAAKTRVLGQHRLEAYLSREMVLLTPKELDRLVCIAPLEPDPASDHWYARFKLDDALMALALGLTRPN